MCSRKEASRGSSVRMFRKKFSPGSARQMKLLFGLAQRRTQGYQIPGRRPESILPDRQRKIGPRFILTSVPDAATAANSLCLVPPHPLVYFHCLSKLRAYSIHLPRYTASSRVESGRPRDPNSRSKGWRPWCRSTLFSPPINQSYGASRDARRPS